MSIQKLTPACKNYLWGGNKLKEKYGKVTSDDVLAETWELSFHPDGPTLAENGKPLSEVLTARELGQNVKDFPFFPVLVKFIDAKGDLSFQVHPSDDYALQNENSYGKTEMWYVVGAEPGITVPLQAAVDKYSFGGESAPACRVVTAEAGNRAGILGAAALWMED